jgi:hypothetical protein
VAGGGRDLTPEQFLLNRKLLTVVLDLKSGRMPIERAERWTTWLARTDAVVARILLGELMKLPEEELSRQVTDIPMPEAILETRRRRGVHGINDQQPRQREGRSEAPVDTALLQERDRIARVRYLLGARPASQGA